MSRKAPLPNCHTADEVLALSRESEQLFRKQRLSEPLERYAAEFDTYTEAVGRVLMNAPDMPTLVARLPELMRDDRTREVLRALAGPPISEDDLNTLAEANVGTKRSAGDQETVRRVAAIIGEALDHKRFPWLKSGRTPTAVENHAAHVATAALIAVRRTETSRRHSGKSKQEASVAACLSESGWTVAPRATITTMADAPPPKSYCGECLLGTRQADLVARMPDGRILAIECKVSNSKVNSFKRLNNDAAVKARAWVREFGERNIIPVAVLGGVFNPKNVIEAQRDIYLFWEHRLDELCQFLAQST